MDSIHALQAQPHQSCDIVPIRMRPVTKSHHGERKVERTQLITSTARPRFAVRPDGSIRIGGIKPPPAFCGQGPRFAETRAISTRYIAIGNSEGGISAKEA